MLRRFPDILPAIDCIGAVFFPLPFFLGTALVLSLRYREISLKAFDTDLVPVITFPEKTNTISDLTGSSFAILIGREFFAGFLGGSLSTRIFSPPYMVSPFQPFV